jgi:hypothetical protein
MCYKFKILGIDAYESLDHSDLTFKAGWNDILGMNQKTSLNLKYEEFFRIQLLIREEKHILFKTLWTVQFMVWHFYESYSNYLD